METGDMIDKITRDIAKEDMEWREAYIKEYLTLTGYKIEELEMVQKRTNFGPNIELSYYLRKKE